MADNERVPAPAFPVPPPSSEGASRPSSREPGEPPLSFREWMLAELERRRWRQADFARATGIDVSMVSRWLHGRRPDTGSLERVATTLGIDLDTLLTMAGYRRPASHDDDPRVAALVAKVRQVNWTAERFLIVDALLDDLRRRSPRVPVEQTTLPGWETVEGGENPA